MMYSKRRLPDIEQWSQSSGSNVIPRRARPGLAGIRPHTRCLAIRAFPCTRMHVALHEIHTLSCNTRVALHQNARCLACQCTVSCVGMHVALHETRALPFMRHARCLACQCTVHCMRMHGALHVNSRCLACRCTVPYTRHARCLAWECKARECTVPCMRHARCLARECTVPCMRMHAALHGNVRCLGVPWHRYTATSLAQSDGSRLCDLSRVPSLDA